MNKEIRNEKKVEVEKTDLQLVEAFKKNGDKDAFSELVLRYSDKVYKLGFRITRNEQDAEEVVQDTLLSVFNKINTFKGESAFSSWLFRITANSAFMKLRNRKKHIAASFEDVAHEDIECCNSQNSALYNVDYISTKHELQDQLAKAIAKLPEEYHQIFILRDVDDLSNAQVSKILNLSIPAVKSRLHRARLLLREELETFYSDYKDANKIYYKDGANVLENAA